MITDPMSILAVLLLILAALFGLNTTSAGRTLYRFVPLLVFAYFVPALLSNLGIIPTQSDLYTFIKQWMLPASLVLLTLSVDIPAIARLGRNAVLLFLTATVGIVIGGPLALLVLRGFLPVELGEESWKGLAALSGSWIGGGANFIAIGSSVGVQDATLGLMVVVDVVIANIWMAVLLFFAGREKAMDERIGADRTTLDALRTKIEAFQAEVARPTTLADLLMLLAVAIGGTVLAQTASHYLPEIGQIVSRFTWVVLGVTTLGVGLSFTRARALEGAGASAVGSVMLYLLVASIGAHADFAKVVEAPALIAIGALWMTFHAVTILAVRHWLKAPIFFAAVGSQANVGGAASAPIVASAFHPALAPVGVLLAVGGYVLGTYAGLVCAFLLEVVYKL